ncbi:TIGR04024 family LLM class F420-dependent oxidoreductase [Natrialbaceae archaeon AArc-T1-2]|uniref:TIGR04024 family LLM class F420-dependent oxidoreductase n=1 Tax=Natrialbaceae archaeon AArc-T1-2 TaxID=3053904 RepID=UPI00255B0E4A|nr:TIGR04024 family LLM class F420-dependent oxidoreductase [Natrialbaceae archaeon AArc-T1-2]WIV67860.1 TIGR04024 family LLM class F420-dependent oxidoreductase [Natrialbaceae archaeon AArc-T1-2]
MTDRTLHLPVAAQPRVETLLEYAVRGEDCGYERVWLPETWGRDAVSVLTRVATETDEIGLGPSICNVYSRSPALLAQTATTLQEIADGRLRVGIGPSGPAVIEGWHGDDFDRPLRRTRECLEVMRAVMSGETVDYNGELFTLGGFRLRCDPPDEPVPIDVAGMGPTAVELAGRFADGWHATVFTPDGLRDRLEDLRRGATLGDRDPDDVRTTLSVTACALEDGERARELVAGHVAFYVGAMGTYYRESLARQGYEDVATEIATAWGSGDRQRASALAAELLDELGAAGTPDRAREQLARFEAVDGLDAIAVSFPRGASSEEVRTTIEALAP